MTDLLRALGMDKNPPPPVSSLKLSNVNPLQPIVRFEVSFLIEGEEPEEEKKYIECIMTFKDGKYTGLEDLKGYDYNASSREGVLFFGELDRVRKDLEEQVQKARGSIKCR